MTEQDNNDQEINEYLEKDSALSDLYQRSKAQAGPSELLDQRILKAASDAAKSHRSKSSIPYSGHWYKPLSAAAIIILSIGLVTLVQKNYDRDTLLSDIPHEQFSDNAEEAPMVMQDPLRARPATPNQMPMKEKQESFMAEPAQTESYAPAIEGDRSDSGADAIAPESAPASTAPNVFNRQLKIPTDMESRKRDSVSATPAANDEMILQQDMESVDAIESPAPEKTLELKKQGIIMPETATGVASSPLTAPDNTVDNRMDEISDTTSPEEWLEIIRDLYHSGKTDAADTMLKKFKQRYPDYPIDETLK